MKLNFQKTEIPFNPIIEPKLKKNEVVEVIRNNFKIPDDNLNDIISFIKQDSELEKIILEIPDLIKKEFPNDEMQIKFYKEFQEIELILEIGVFTSFDEELSFEKEKKLENILYDKYNWDSADKILILMEYQV